MQVLPVFDSCHLCLSIDSVHAIFLSFFLVWQTSNLITRVSWWWCPNEPLRNRESILGHFSPTIMAEPPVGENCLQCLCAGIHSITACTNTDQGTNQKSQELKLSFSSQIHMLVCMYDVWFVCARDWKQEGEWVRVRASTSVFVTVRVSLGMGVSVGESVRVSNCVCPSFYAFVHVYMYVCLQVCKWICVHKCTRIRVVCSYLHTHVHCSSCSLLKTHTHTYTHQSARSCTHIHARI